MKRKEDDNRAVDPEVQEILDRAEVDVSMEQIEQVREEADSPAQSEEEQEAEAVKAVENDHILILSREYSLDGKKIDRLDFSKLPDLTTRDLEYADRIVARLQHDPADKYRDTLWVKYIAVRATGLAPDFFNALSMRDMLGIVGVVRTYFLLGWE